jgi:hypothetical protein
VRALEVLELIAAANPFGPRFGGGS